MSVTLGMPPRPSAIRTQPGIENSLLSASVSALSVMPMSLHFVQEGSDGKLRSKVVFTKSDTCLIHERRCRYRPAIYHVSGAPCRVRCRGPNLNRLSSTLVQLNQNKIYFFGGGEHDCKRVRKAGSCPLQTA